MTLLVDAQALSISGRLHATSIHLASGGLVCLVGPNGSGKTSLLHALARIGSPGGSVRIAGEDPDRLGPARRQRLLSYLPAAREPRWPIMVRDLVRLGLPRNVSVSDAVDALELESLLDRSVDRLSTGERSRALIARALAPSSHLLLLDEPTANLDPLWQIKLMDLLRRKSRQGDTAVLLAMHDLDLAARYAERLIVMQDGHIAGDGAPADLIVGGTITQVFGIRRVDGAWVPA